MRLRVGRGRPGLAGRSKRASAWCAWRAILELGDAGEEFWLSTIGRVSDGIMWIAGPAERGFGVTADGYERRIAQLILQTFQDRDPNFSLDRKMTTVIKRSPWLVRMKRKDVPEEHSRLNGIQCFPDGRGGYLGLTTGDRRRLQTSQIEPGAVGLKAAVVCHGQACSPAAAMPEFEPDPDRVHTPANGGREDGLKIAPALGWCVWTVADLAGVAIGIEDVFEPQAREIRDEVAREPRAGGHGSRR